MSRYGPIVIACPERRKAVRGQYECDDRGNYLLAPDGSFVLSRLRCGLDRGCCAQTLCALHPYNRKGPGTWLPDEIILLNRSAPPRKPRRKERSSSLSGLY